MTKEYIRAYIEATDDGTFESEDALADFVIDALYDEEGDVSDIVNEVMAERRQTMRHDYEDAFDHYRPEYLVTGRKNPCRYRITGEFNTADFWCEDADNKEEIEDIFSKINRNETIIQNTISMQNEFGQLMWTKEFGWSDTIKHPKYMDTLKCFERKGW